MDYKPIKLQIGFFLTSIDLSKKVRISSMVSEKSRGFLEIDPLLLPLPPDSPPEFPLILMNNQENGWAFQIGRGRMDLLINVAPPKVLDNFVTPAEQIQEVAIDIFKGLVEKFSTRANRIGFFTQFVDFIENPCDILNSKYVKDDLLDNAAEAQIQFLHKINVEQFELNKSIRLLGFSETKLSQQPSIPSRIVLEIDVNTLAEKPIELHNDIPNMFFNISNRLIEETLIKYS